MILIGKRRYFQFRRWCVGFTERGQCIRRVGTVTTAFIEGAITLRKLDTGELPVILQTGIYIFFVTKFWSHEWKNDMFTLGCCSVRGEGSLT